MLHTVQFTEIYKRKENLSSIDDGTKLATWLQRLHIYHRSPILKDQNNKLFLNIFSYLLIAFKHHNEHIFSTIFNKRFSTGPFFHSKVKSYFSKASLNACAMVVSCSLLYLQSRQSTRSGRFSNESCANASLEKK